MLRALLRVRRLTELAASPDADCMPLDRMSVIAKFEELPKGSCWISADPAVSTPRWQEANRSCSTIETKSR